MISDRLYGKAQWVRLPADARVTVHPAVADIARMADTRYLATRLDWLSGTAAQLLILHRPLIVVRFGRGYGLVGGFRTWAVARQLMTVQTAVPAFVLPGRIDPDAARTVAAFDVAVLPLLTSFDRNGVHQIDAIFRSLTTGYVRPGPGRPCKVEQEPGPLDDLVAHPLRTGELAEIMGLAPSTLRRRR